MELRDFGCMYPIAMMNHDAARCTECDVPGFQQGVGLNPKLRNSAPRDAPSVQRVGWLSKVKTGRHKGTKGDSNPAIGGASGGGAVAEFELCHLPRPSG